MHRICTNGLQRKETLRQRKDKLTELSKIMLEMRFRYVYLSKSEVFMCKVNF